jgi:hypothetical protein
VSKVARIFVNSFTVGWRRGRFARTFDGSPMGRMTQEGDALYPYYRLGPGFGTSVHIMKKLAVVGFVP